MSNTRLGTLIAAAIVTVSAGAGAQVIQEKVDLSVAARIRDEGLNRSHIDSLAGYLSDVIGPRLTGSTNIRRGEEWAAGLFRTWGLTNIKIEPWDSAFGRGWERVSYSARFLEPFIQPLNATPQAWSGSTRGAVICDVLQLDTQDTLTFFTRYPAGSARGKCVAYQAPAEIGPEFARRELRIDADSLLAQIARQPQEGGGRRGGGGGRRGGGPGQPPSFQQRFSQWVRAEQPAAILLGSRWTYGMLLSGGHPDGGTARDSVYNPIPALLVSHEHYGQIWRNLQRKVPVKLELNVQNRFLDERRSNNVVAEIAGRDRPQEVVMIGAHFDSWHGGSGSTDNAAGSVVMMEAMRILKTLGLPLRRTARIALWSGEEQGLIGSRHYVRMHAAEMPNISAYLNVDNGTGRLRGIANQSNLAVTPIFEQILAPFRDLGVVGVRTNNAGGTDHLSFDRVGVPGFNYIQDPIEYNSRTHHSNVDTYERLVIEDLKQAAVIVAFTVYTIANRDEMIPRKQTAPTGTNQ